VVAIAMLSWMLIWMTRQRGFKTEVTAALKDNSGAGWGVFTLVLIAVLREGFETVVFIAANFQLIPAFGALAGFRWHQVLLFKWGVKINIRLFSR